LFTHAASFQLKASNLSCVFSYTEEHDQTAVSNYHVTKTETSIAISSNVIHRGNLRFVGTPEEALKTEDPILRDFISKGIHCLSKGEK